MEAGYDYLLERSRLQNRFLKASGILLVVIGTVCVGAGIAYFVYADRARAGLKDLNYTVQRPQDDPLTTFPFTHTGPITDTGPGAVVTTPPLVQDQRPANFQAFDETRVNTPYIGSTRGSNEAATESQEEAPVFIGPEEPPISGSSPVQAQTAVGRPRPSDIALRHRFPAALSRRVRRGQLLEQPSGMRGALIPRA